MNELILFLFGLVCHQTRKYTRQLPVNWGGLTEHVIGAGMIFAGLLFLRKVTKNESFITMYTRVVLWLGLGVALGHAMDDDALEDAE